jgi:hypothetical protein
MFDAKLARTTADSAAKTILRGVAGNRARVLIGWDAKALDLIVRVLGSGYQRLVTFGASKAMGAARKAQAPNAASVQARGDAKTSVAGKSKASA